VVEKETTVRNVQADGLLFFLNRLQDFLWHSLRVQNPISPFGNIIYKLECNPKITLHDKSTRARLLNLFMKL
jgi:hypothetical protein